MLCHTSERKNVPVLTQLSMYLIKYSTYCNSAWHNHGCVTQHSKMSWVMAGEGQLRAYCHACQGGTTTLFPELHPENSGTSKQAWKADFRNSVNAQPCAICVLNISVVLIFQANAYHHASRNIQNGLFPFSPLLRYTLHPFHELTQRSLYAVLTYHVFCGQ